MAKKNHRAPLDGVRAVSDQSNRPPLDPLLEPLIAQVADISQRLGLLRRLVDFKVQEVEALYKHAQLLGRKAAARLLDMSESQFDRQVRDGKLEHISINRRTRVSLSDLEMYVEARRRLAGRSKHSTGPQKTRNLTPDKTSSKKKKT